MGTILWLLQLLGISITLGKYVYIKKQKDWDGASSLCQTQYTDLAPVNDESDVKLLRELAGDYPRFIWFGLLRNTTDKSKWRWSGGGEVKTFMWDVGEPNSGLTNSEDFGLMINYRWHDAPGNYPTHAFCFSVHVVREEKTWEDALKYCREKHKDLASISSETEMMLIQRELDKVESTEHVWMGLSFLSGEWLWVDGSASGFEAWGQGSKLTCPRMSLSCGALVAKSNAWEAHNCEDKLHFICY